MLRHQLHQKLYILKKALILAKCKAFSGRSHKFPNLRYLYGRGGIKKTRKFLYTSRKLMRKVFSKVSEQQFEMFEGWSEEIAVILRLVKLRWSLFFWLELEPEPKLEPT